MPDLRPIEDAPKDRTPILATMRDDLVEYEGRANLRAWAGRQVVLHHPGLADDGFDIGWSVSGPVGHGGIPDDWLSGWQPLGEEIDPAAAARRLDAHERDWITANRGSVVPCPAGRYAGRDARVDAASWIDGPAGLTFQVLLMVLRADGTDVLNSHVDSRSYWPIDRIPQLSLDV